MENGEESITAATKDGSLDWHGRSIIERRTGGWQCALMILGILNEYSDVKRQRKMK